MDTKITIQDLGKMRYEANIGRRDIEPHKWENFCAILLQRIDLELNEAVTEAVTEALERSRLDQEIWICLQVKGQQVILLGSWTAKPDLVALSSVHKVETLLSIKQVKTLIEELEMKIDNFSSFRLMRLESQ